jgi:hypothetical protein
MPVETGSTISALIATWPLSGDFVSEGDNHLNLIKSVLKKQFPGSDNQGFNTPILATEAELNYVQGARSNIQAQIDNIEVGPGGSGEFPASTTMVFFQATPPAGWTQLTANNDSMLRVVTTNGGQSGGSASPISHAHSTGDWTLTASEMPFHWHAMFTSVTAGGSGPTQPGDLDRVAYKANYSVDESMDYGVASSGGGSNVGISGANGLGDSHNHGTTGGYTPRYINVITAVKD